MLKNIFPKRIQKISIENIIDATRTFLMNLSVNKWIKQNKAENPAGIVTGSAQIVSAIIKTDVNATKLNIEKLKFTSAFAFS